MEELLCIKIEVQAEPWDLWVDLADDSKSDFQNIKVLLSLLMIKFNFSTMLVFNYTILLSVKTC